MHARLLVCANDPKCLRGRPKAVLLYPFVLLCPFFCPYLSCFKDMSILCRQTNEILASRAQKEVTVPAHVSLVSPRRCQVAPLFFTTFNQFSHPQEAVDGIFFYILLQRPTAQGTTKDTQVRQREKESVCERVSVSPTRPTTTRRGTKDTQVRLLQLLYNPSL